MPLFPKESSRKNNSCEDEFDLDLHENEPVSSTEPLLHCAWSPVRSTMPLFLTGPLCHCSTVPEFHSAIVPQLLVFHCSTNISSVPTMN